MSPLHSTLPAAFDSWARVLTDWKVIGVFNSCPPAPCFGKHPELAAPLVAEISAAIREKQLRRRPTEAAIQREKVTEPAYDRFGGPPYLSLRHQMMSAQENYFAQRRSPRAEPASLSVLHTQMEQRQLEYSACRRRHEPLVEHARTTSIRAYWAAHPSRGISDDFFDDLPVRHSISRLIRIAPSWWWREGFSRLQARLAHHHAADGCFLDALPALRAQAKKKTLAALIAEWSLEHRNQFGWDGPGHYRMLADRAGAKAKSVTAWFDQKAPSYLTDEAVRKSLHARLVDTLTVLDPLEKLLADERRGLSEHWRN